LASFHSPLPRAENASKPQNDSPNQNKLEGTTTIVQNRIITTTTNHVYFGILLVVAALERANDDRAFAQVPSKSRDRLLLDETVTRLFSRIVESHP
jgi:hypothetical protein